MIGVSAIQNYKILELIELAWSDRPLVVVEEPTEEVIKVAVIGRPNSGKSTLVNQIIQEQRSVVSPEAGTTRDSVDIAFTFNDKKFLFIDTAGIRRRHKEKNAIEKYASLRTEDAMNRAEIAIFIVDALLGVSVQDRKILNEIQELGKGCILLINKWDLVKGVRMEHYIQDIRTNFSFLDHVPIF